MNLSEINVRTIILINGNRKEVIQFDYKQGISKNKRWNNLYAGNHDRNLFNNIKIQRSHFKPNPSYAYFPLLPRTSC